MGKGVYISHGDTFPFKTGISTSTIAAFLGTAIRLDDLKEENGGILPRRLHTSVNSKLASKYFVHTSGVNHRSVKGERLSRNNMCDVPYSPDNQRSRSEHNIMTPMSLTAFTMEPGGQTPVRDELSSIIDVRGATNIPEYTPKFPSFECIFRLYCRLLVPSKETATFSMSQNQGAANEMAKFQNPIDSFYNIRKKYDDLKNEPELQIVIVVKMIKVIFAFVTEFFHSLKDFETTVLLMRKLNLCGHMDDSFIAGLTKNSSPQLGVAYRAIFCEVTANVDSSAAVDDPPDATQTPTKGSLNDSTQTSTKGSSSQQLSAVSPSATLSQCLETKKYAFARFLLRVQLSQGYQFLPSVIDGAHRCIQTALSVEGKHLENSVLYHEAVTARPVSESSQIYTPNPGVSILLSSDYSLTVTDFVQKCSETSQFLMKTVASACASSPSDM